MSSRRETCDEVLRLAVRPGVSLPRSPLAVLPLATLLVACAGGVAPDAPTADPVAVRVEATRTRLAASEGGQLLDRVIEAHGGLDTWARTESLRFEFDYLPAGKPEARRHSINTVHVPTSRVRQEQVGGEVVMGWDGQQAWIAPREGAFPSPARFWALTPYYFVGMPFVLADPGTRHERLPDGELDGQPVERVKVTFDPGTGDAPDDYYIVDADPQTHRMRALTYIVSSPVLFKEGGQSGEKRLAWLDQVQVDGLWFASRYDGVNLKDGEPASAASTVAIRDIRRNVAVDDTTFAPVDGATTGL